MSKRSLFRFGVNAVFVSFVASNASALAATEDAEGKDLFLKYKCTTCHSVEVAGIDARQKDKGPDLSGAGSAIPNADWAKEYLLRKTDKDGKKHRKPYKGSEQDLETIIDWLMGLEASS